MAPMVEKTSHHHRSDSKASHKPFKSRHASKNSIRELAKGKIEATEKKSLGRKTRHQQVMAKFDRKNQAKQMRIIKRQQHQRSASVFAGPNGAPRVVAVVPLCEDLSAVAAIESLNQAVEAESVWPLEGHMKVRVDRFKQNLIYIPVERSLVTALDACKCADFVIFLLSPTTEAGEEAELLLKAIEGQGVSNVLTMVQNLDSVASSKAKSQITASLKTYITRFFPAQEKVFSLDAENECANAMRSLCTTTPKGIHWREGRSWMLTEDIQWPSATDPSSEHGNLVVTGVVRGRNLKANGLVQIGDWGPFQIEKINAATLPTSKKRKADEMAIDNMGEGQILEEPTVEQEDLAELAPYEANMEDAHSMSVSEVSKDRRGVLLDDHHYFSDDETHLPEAPKRVPKGTSSYQAAWFLGDFSESGSDFDDEVDEGMGDVEMVDPSQAQDAPKEMRQFAENEPTEAAPSEYPQSEMFLDPAPDEEAAQLAEYRASRKKTAEEDLEFPDEIELHPNVVARERLARYRGLKSLKSSHWETSEDKPHEPEDWDRLLVFPDYRRAKKQAENSTLIDGVQPGQRVHVHLRNVPLSLQTSYNPRNPLALYSLLRHEQKRTVVNISLTLSSDCPNPIKSKEELILQCGPRRLVINPLFSEMGDPPNNVHRFKRYLHPGHSAIASFIAPFTWGSVPALFFQASASSASPLRLIATGTSRPPSTTRVIAKRIQLTGHPYKIHKKLVTVRYMFFNKADIAWFKALQLWTKRGRSGFIKEVRPLIPPNQHKLISTLHPEPRNTRILQSDFRRTHQSTSTFLTFPLDLPHP